MSTKKLKKLFWSWDHSTNWCLNTIGRQNCGVANPYTKKGGEFIKDYMRMIDFCAENKIDAVGVAGLLRDSHGSWDSARKVCAYGHEKGVCVYMIAGLYSYGGLYYEGDSELSLNRFLERNPECMAKSFTNEPAYIKYHYPHGVKCEPTACPGNKLVRNFVLDTLAYLFAALPELGGIQIEAGDAGLCMCETCRARREELKGGESQLPFLSLSDMADIYPDAVSVIRNTSKNAWIMCESYVHFLNNKAFNNSDSPAMQKLLTMPKDVYWQWSDRRLRPGMWTDDVRLPEHLRGYGHIMRCHHGTQWDGGRHTLVVERIREQCRLTALSGMNAVSIFGECSPFHANTEFNYLALSYFGDNPQASLTDFIVDVMACRLGGNVSWAEQYLQWSKLIAVPERIPAAVQEIARISNEVSRNYDALYRWNYLASFLNAYYYEYCQSNSVKSGGKVNLDVR